jgi:uncharacterized membrane protein
MPTLPKQTARFRLWPGLGILALLALGSLAKLLPPTGDSHGRITQFFGRFHPLIIHIPIGLILLVPILELAGAAAPRAHLRATTQFVLWLAALGALAAAFDGWLLAWSGGYRGALVTRHMWAGVGLAALCLATAWVRSAAIRRHPGGRKAGPVYMVLLVSLLGLLTWASDQGGKLTHGDNFLVQYMPGRLRTLLGTAAPPPPPVAAPARPGSASSLYTVRIQPILNRSCVSCHGTEKVKGGLRLDSYAQLMQGGEDGAAVEPWRPDKSELLRRVTLSPDDDDFMPNNNKNVLSAAEVKVIQEWIAGGASELEPASAVGP